MDLINWSFPIWATIICSLPLLAFASLIAWRIKYLKAGLYIYLYPTAYFAVAIFFSWLLSNLVPQSYIRVLLSLISVGSFIFLCGTGILYGINANKAGRLKETSADDMAKLNTIGGWVFLGLAIAAFLISKFDLSNVSVLWSVLFAANLLGRTFLSFQLRERGIVSWGKFIKFADVTSMRWVNLRNKEEVEYTLKDFPQAQRLKIHWNFITPIDSYISTHFPRT